MVFPISHIRDRFPSLSVKDGERDRIYLDNPAGTQVPSTVIDAITHYLLHNASNAGGAFATSIETDRTWRKAHEDMATFLGANSAAEIVIGQSMTSLTFHLSRSICHDFRPGDQIVITRMEHEGNVGPWLEIARDRGLEIRWVEFNRDSWQIEPEDLAASLTERTRLVALNYASNMTGSVNDVKRLTRIAQDAGALVYVDAVQLAPHHLVDVQALGCDFLACSSYKFFGPHMGIVWGKEELLTSLYPYKGRCVSDASPDRFEMGTPQYELLAGLSATVEYFAELGALCGGSGDMRAQIAHAYDAQRRYEEPITNQLIAGLQTIPGVTIYGISNPNRIAERVTTVSFRHDRHDPKAIATALAQSGIHVWHGHNYAYEPARALNLPLEEGVVRIGLSHYNTQSEVEHTLNEITKAVKIAG
ncbi:cysteine desulfurase-like protein [Roseovarius aestuarii]|uniref:Putative cysteine desulfurase n=1 Tax=Roseovarius aestuarii TaxID=475083 RepID=A0A1X7BWT0_9RHOB|nr:cysteine desulfurase-like protein [Roseovarius aestuarii]SMC14096.1 putative cysteine desulfurase [Roseovarius aestuarii]